MIRRRAFAATSAAAAAVALPRPTSSQPRRVDLEPMPLPVKQDDAVARGYRRDLLLRWGDRVAYDAPRWEPNFPRPEAAAGQFGWDARVAAVAVPQRQAADGVPRAVLCVLHPTVDPLMAWPGGGVDRPVVAAAMQGASLLNLERRGSGWVVVDGGYQTRRLHGGTLCRLSGPRGGGGSVQGLLGLGGGCTTPWGTLLLAEGDPAPWAARLGAVDPRFAAAGAFGWVAELDPFDPGAVPVKRTGLGRGNHGDVAAALARDGRAVVYTTDRRVGGFLRRFVSAGLATDPGALDSGTHSVARFEGGRLDWVPAQGEAGGAGEAAGGSPLDTPAGLGLDPSGPRLLLCCHGSPARPRGHVIEISATGGDDAAPTASVRLLFAAGAPAEGGQYGRAGLPPGSAWPENPSVAAVDGRGRAWIGTDRAGVIGAQADGLFACDLDGPNRGVPLPVYGAPRAGAIGGAALTPDGEVLFAAVRHPGAEPGARFERPGTRWPEFQPGVPPRSALLGLQRAAGGPVGG